MLRLATLLVVGLVWSVQVSASNQPAGALRIDLAEDADSQHPAQEQRDLDPSPHFPASIPVGEHPSAQNHTAHLGDDDEFWRVFGHKVKITDSLLVLFTALLFIATWLLWSATKRLVKGSEKTAQAQLRAYVTLKKALIRNFAVGEEPQGYIVVENAGQTPGYEVKGILGIALVPWPIGASPSLPQIEANKGPIGPRMEKHLTANIGVALSQAQYDAVVKGTHAFHVLGRLEYMDIFGRTRHTSFDMTYGGQPGANVGRVLMPRATGNEAT